jgi:hypothetical protein
MSAGLRHVAPSFLAGLAATISVDETAFSFAVKFQYMQITPTPTQGNHDGGSGGSDRGGDGSSGGGGGGGSGSGDSLSSAEYTWTVELYTNGEVNVHYASVRDPNENKNKDGEKENDDKGYAVNGRTNDVFAAGLRSRETIPLYAHQVG